MHEKLEKIYMDVDFEDSDISSVVNYLKAKSSELDPNKEGVNFVVKIPNEAQESISVTLNLTNCPLSEILHYLCKTTGLQYRIADKTVLIGTHDLDDIETRFIKVRSYLIARIAVSEGGDEEGGGGAPGMRSTDPDGGSSRSSGNRNNRRRGIIGDQDDSGGGDDFSVEDAFGDLDLEDIFDEMEIRDIMTVTPEMLRTYFEDRGVSFSAEGAAIAYDSRSGKLTVTNTTENLRKLETLIRELDLENPQVLVECKMMEVGVEDLESFGFDWALTHQNVNNNWTFNLNTTLGSSADSLINNMNILPNFG